MSELEKTTLGGGCFWCVESAFKQIRGVENVVSGYSGGETDHPSYEEVCSGMTNHVEVVQVTYEPGEIGFKDILTVFFSVHDPTQVNRQGPDVGPQYRSIIFHHNHHQKKISEETIQELESADHYDKPIATEVVALEKFYAAEEYHQDYYEKNPNQAYCRRMIPPKLETLEKNHSELLM